MREMRDLGYPALHITDDILNIICFTTESVVRQLFVLLSLSTICKDADSWAVQPSDLGSKAEHVM